MYTCMCAQFAALVGVLDAFLVTLESLATFFLLLSFGAWGRVVHGLANLLLQGMGGGREEYGSSPRAAGSGRSARPDGPDGAVPSTLNYLWSGADLSLAEDDLGAADGTKTFARARRRRLSSDALVPPRASLTQTLGLAAQLAVHLVFDVPRALLGLCPMPKLDAQYRAQYHAQYHHVRHVVRAAGYPLEEHTVTTSDGCRLELQRLPCEGASRVVFFMHGVLDTSLGWVWDGPIGSHAFAAHDAGADVWLGNSRAVYSSSRSSSRSSALPKGPSTSWAHSINELGLQDMEAMLGHVAAHTTGDVHVVAHSLGAASVLIHLVFADAARARQERVKQLVLLAPAGFHSRAPFLALPFVRTVPPLVRLADGVSSGRWGMPAYVPSSLLRYVAFTLATDVHSVPALNELSRWLLRILFNGDSSDWDRALQMPHYAAASMPALSVRTGAHLLQLIRRRKFELYDYGWRHLNQKHYGRDAPPDVAERYGALRDRGIRVRLVAGSRDGVVGAADVRRHHARMAGAGVDVSYTELDLGHLDLCFGGHEDVVRLVHQYVMAG
jgi:hypothetical protein